MNQNVVITAIAAIVSGTAMAALPMNNLACCAVARSSNQVVNADQTVIIVWDKESQTQHFIRKADFKTDASDFGFLVPSPSRPQLEESGQEAFAKLDHITRPMVSESVGFPLGCAVAAPNNTIQSRVTVIEEKRVAGFDATVLTADSGEDLVNWLKENGYAYSPAVAEWAKPYLGGSWHFTALKVVKSKESTSDDKVKAASLRISFKTDRPLFPYREPDSAISSSNLGAKHRLLRIYFIAEAQYEGKIDGRTKWNGKSVWSGDITAHRQDLLDSLKLTGSKVPSKWWLTKIDHQWPYHKAAGDVYFAPAAKQSTFDLSAVPDRHPVDATGLVMLAAFSWVLFAKQARKNVGAHAMPETATDLVSQS